MFAQVRWPELNLLFHVPNGGLRHWIEGGRLKQAGVKAGVPDLFLPVARGNYHGLFIELKARSGKVSKEQHSWLIELDKQGYAARLCYGADEAISAIERYMQAET